MGTKKNIKNLKKIVDISLNLIYNNSRVTERTDTGGRAPAKTGVWLSLARVPDLGSGGRRFESCHPDFINLTVAAMQVWFNGRTPAFQAGYVGSIPITCFSMCQ